MTFLIKNAARVIWVDWVRVCTQEGYLLYYTVKICMFLMKHWTLSKMSTPSPFLGTIMIYFRLGSSLRKFLPGESQVILVLGGLLHPFPPEETDQPSQGLGIGASD